MREPQPTFKFKGTEVYATTLFPFQQPISRKSYRRFLFRFFTRLKSMPKDEQIAHFFENYHSTECCAWYRIDGVVYFTIVFYPCTPEMEVYYGKQTIFINI